MRKWVRFFFLVYVTMMLWLLFDRSGAVKGVPYWQQVQQNINLKPFHTVGSYWHILTNRAYYVEKWESASIYFYHARIAFVNLAGNVVMFVPLGCFIPAVWKKCASLFRCFFCALGMILAVEIFQLLTLLGSCDVDDLILNMAGVVLGYGIYRLYHPKKHKKNRKNQRRKHR